MVSTSDRATRVSFPSRGHCVVFLSRALHSHSDSFPHRDIRGTSEEAIRLRVAPVSLSPSRKTRKKPVKKRMVGRDPGGKKHTKISRGHFFFLEGCFRVSLDGLSERGTTRGLESYGRREPLMDLGPNPGD